MITESTTLGFQTTHVYSSPDRKTNKKTIEENVEILCRERKTEIKPKITDISFERKHDLSGGGWLEY